MAVESKKPRKGLLDRFIRASWGVFASFQGKVTSISLRQCGRMSCANSETEAISRCLSELALEEEKPVRFTARERYSMDGPRSKTWKTSQRMVNRCNKLTYRQFSGHTPEDIELECLIGKGAHGMVHKAHLQGHKVAVKIIQECNSVGPRHLSSTPEMALLFGIAHPNLVQIFGVHAVEKDFDSISMDDDSLFDTDMFGSDAYALEEDSEKEYMRFSETWIVMELCEKGSLWEAVKRGEFNIGCRNGPLNYKRVLEVGLEIAFAMQHLHELDIIHGDLKAQNILLCEDPFTKKCTAKVGDFGLCRRPQPHRPDLTTFSMGTVDHMPPETLRDGRIHNGTDVYSFAVLLVEMMTGNHPFSGMTTPAVMIAVIDGMRPEVPQNCPASIANLIKSCWDQDWSRRPTFSVIVGQMIRILC